MIWGCSRSSYKKWTKQVNQAIKAALWNKVLDDIKIPTIPQQRDMEQILKLTNNKEFSKIIFAADAIHVECRGQRPETTAICC